MRGDFYQQLTNDLETARAEGLFKEERIITSAQQADITVANGSHVINFCANNYLGLANHPELIAAAKAGMDSHGFGMASVRFICGTQDSHKVLEQKLAEFLGMEDSILYSSCFDANGGLFETLLGAEDAIISDALNHASIIDGVRLCKAKRYRYANNDMQELEARLKEAREAGARHVLIATDGVFSMDGVIANLKGVCDLADKYDALVMVDDSHAVGFVGANGRGTHEYCDVMGRVDIITGTLGKALGLYPDEVVLRGLYQDRELAKQGLLDALHKYGCLPKRAGHKASLMSMTGILNRGMQRYIADSNSALLGLQPEDWLEMATPVNIPGTSTEYPNWRRKLSVTLEQMFADERVNKLIKDLDKRRKAASKKAAS